MAIRGAKKVKTMTLKTPPIKEATTAVVRALWASPLRAMGYPSKMVHMAAGVPGVLMSMALTAPP